MMGFFKKKIENFFVPILDTSWNIILQTEFTYIPRYGELIYIDILEKYYRVINVIHYVQEHKTHTSLIVEETALK